MKPPIQAEDVTFVAPMVPLPEVVVQLLQSEVVFSPVAFVPVNTESYLVAPVSVPLTPVVRVPPLHSDARLTAITEPSIL